MTACGSSAAPGSQSVALGTEFTLAPAAKATVQGGMEVQFVSITEDSRCPKDATCVWAGQVKVNLSIAVGKTPAASHEVLEGADATVDGYQVKVIRVLPYPATNAPIAPADYRVTLQAARN